MKSKKTPEVPKFLRRIHLSLIFLWSLLVFLALIDLYLLIAEAPCNIYDAWSENPILEAVLAFSIVSITILFISAITLDLYLKIWRLLKWHILLLLVLLLIAYLDFNEGFFYCDTLFTFN